MMTLSGRFVFQLQEPVGPAREVFQIRMTNDNSFATIPLYIAHNFQGVVDIGDRLKLDRTHDFITGNATQAGYPITGRGWSVKGFEYHSRQESTVPYSTRASALTINPVINLAIEGDTLGKRIAPFLGKLNVDSATTPKPATIPKGAASVIFLAGDPAVNLLTGIHHAVHHIVFVHVLPRVKLYGVIGQQNSREVNSISGSMAGLFLKLGQVMNTPVPPGGYMMTVV